MGTQDRLIVTIKAAAMLLDHFDRVLCDRTASSHRLQAADFPLYGIRWMAPLVKALGSSELNKLLASARNSQLSEEDYNSLDPRLCDDLAGDFD